MLAVEPRLGGYVGTISYSGLRSQAIGMTPLEALENAAKEELAAASRVANLLGAWGQVPLEVNHG